jgi:hypothetical protein
MTEWQNRPLDPVCPVIFIDCVHVKVRDGQVANRPVYVALAVTVDGTRASPVSPANGQPRDSSHRRAARQSS